MGNEVHDLLEAENARPALQELFNRGDRMTTQAAQLEDPLFDSTWAALAFAFRYSTQQYQPTPMARLMRGALGSGKGLVGLEGAGQAGIIRAEVEKLPVFEKCAVIARFAIEDKERFGAMKELIVPATSCLGTGVHNRRMVDNLVQRYFGARCFLKDLAETHGVHPDTMTQRWSCIKRQLRDLEYRGIDRVEVRLQETGLIPN